MKNNSHFNLLDWLYMDDAAAEIFSFEESVKNWIAIEIALAETQNKLGLVPDAVLAKMFNDLMFNTGVNTKHFMELVDDYIVKANVPTNLKDISYTRGNLKKELFKSAITWKVFIKGLSFLHVKRFTIGIYLHHYNGKVTEHKKSVNLDDIYSNGD